MHNVYVVRRDTVSNGTESGIDLEMICASPEIADQAVEDLKAQGEVFAAWEEYPAIHDASSTHPPVTSNQPLFFHEMVAALSTKEVAFCVSHTFPEGQRIHLEMDTCRMYWEETGKTVELIPFLLLSKWEILKNMQDTCAEVCV